ncbi:MAG: hypothetical protein ABSC04_00490 [Syntrophobacteraceae bacterium]|jgi:hypothetical protein
MKKSKPPRDINQLAAFIVDQATFEGKPQESTEPQKDPLAVELGRRGGLKGGKARAEKLTPKERQLIALRAAKARWEKRPKPGIEELRN